MTHPLLSVGIRREPDVVVARQRARQLARLLGFDEQDQVRLATAVSEMARNVYGYAREGTISFALEGTSPPQTLSVHVADRGPGIPNLPEILAGRYRSATGMGLGIIGARRLVDHFAIASMPAQGTTVVLKKRLPPDADFLRGPDVARLADALARESVHNPLAEVQQQIERFDPSQV